MMAGKRFPALESQVLQMLARGPATSRDFEEMTLGSPEELEAVVAQLKASGFIEPFTARLKHQQFQQRWRLTSKGEREVRERGYAG